MTTTPHCCGHRMTQERQDFYSCQLCNGEAIWTTKYKCWEYDCPHSLDPNFGYGRRLGAKTNAEGLAEPDESGDQAA